MGVSRPQATSMSGAASRSSRRRTTSTPASQWASPVPETVMARMSTSGDASRNAIATRSSGATSVSISRGTIAATEPLGAGAAVADGTGMVASTVVLVAGVTLA
jgi:hypothetical protein